MIPFTPKTLAQRWQCDEQMIYRMVTNGELCAFKLGGRLVRIPADAVAEYEARGCQISAWGGLGGSSSSSGRKAENAAAIALAREIQRKPAPHSESSYLGAMRDWDNRIAKD